MFHKSVPIISPAFPLSRSCALLPPSSQTSFRQLSLKGAHSGVPERTQVCSSCSRFFLSQALLFFLQCATLRARRGVRRQDGHHLHVDVTVVGSSEAGRLNRLHQSGNTFEPSAAREIIKHVYRSVDKTSGTVQSQPAHKTQLDTLSGPHLPRPPTLATPTWSSYFSAVFRSCRLRHSSA